MQATKEMQRMRSEGMTYRQIAGTLGINCSTVSRAFGGRSDTPTKGEAVKAPTKPKTGVLTTDSIVSQFNTTEKILGALNDLPADEFKRDSDMILLAGITKAAWDKAKRGEKVKAAQVRLPDGSFVWGKPKDAAILRRKLMEV